MLLYCLPVRFSSGLRASSSFQFKPLSARSSAHTAPQQHQVLSPGLPKGNHSPSKTILPAAFLSRRIPSTYHSVQVTPLWRSFPTVHSSLAKRVFLLLRLSTVRIYKPQKITSNEPKTVGSMIATRFAIPRFQQAVEKVHRRAHKGYKNSSTVPKTVCDAELQQLRRAQLLGFSVHYLITESCCHGLTEITRVCYYALTPQEVM